MKKVVSILTAVILIINLLPLICSCGKNDAPAFVATAVQTSETETTQARIYPDLPDADYDSHTFNIINFFDGDDKIWSQRDIASEEQNGELLNDAVYIRNRAIEEKYNCKIASIQYELNQAVTNLKKVINSGDSTIDFATLPLNRINALATMGGLVQYSSIPHIDLTKPWWDPSSVESLSIAGKLFCACSDLTFMDKSATTGMVFNKKLANDYQLDDPYKLVKNGDWTLDKLEEMALSVSVDLDGNGKYNDNDRYGLLYQRDSMTSFLSGCGGMLAVKDENDLPVMSLITPENLEILDKLYNFLYNEQYSFHVMKFFDSKAEKFPAGMSRMFQNDQALFMWIRMADVENLRAMETDFGILPVPKRNKKQERYISTVNPWVGAAVVVPQSTGDLDRTGLIIEALSAESKYVLQPAYYDIMLNTKFTRDEESLEMLDIIFKNRVYDVGDIYDFGTMGNQLIFMTMSYNRNIVSVYDKNEKKIASDIKKLVETYQSME